MSEHRQHGAHSMASQHSPVDPAGSGGGFLDRYHGDARFFGDPDGSRANIADFVEIGELRRSSYTRSREERVRVVVGRKGSGKTFFLKKLKADLKANTSTRLLNGEPATVAEAEQTELMSTEHVIRVAHWFDDKILTEIWQQLWGRAILSSVATHLLHNRDIRDVLSEEQESHLRRYFGPLLSGATWPRSPFVTIRTLINGASSRRDLLRSLENPLWDDLEGYLGYLLEGSPPFYMIVDAIDEEFSNAPMYWMRCQKGLFYEVMRLLRHSRLGARLHIVISIRDLVLYSVFRSEHASRYVGDPHMRVLSWGFDAARAFVDAKLARLDPTLWRGRPSPPANLQEWTGLKSITNRFGNTEDLYSYALRHTQCLPRDVVLLGNVLGPAIERAGIGSLTSTEFKAVIENIARLSGLQQISVAANQMVSDEIPAGAAAHEYTDSYLSVKEYAIDRAAILTEILQECSGTRISVSEMLDLRTRAREILGAPDVGTILWQNGLLGLAGDQGGDVFFSLDRMGRLTLPDNPAGYVFHPSMREVAGLEPKPPAVLWRV